MSNKDQALQNNNAHYIHVEILANSYAKALLIDFPVTLFITLITSLSKKELDEILHISLIKGFYSLISSTAAYTIRSEIKYLLQDYNSNDFTDYLIKGLAGIAGGPIKYGIAKGFTPINIMLGAFNNAGYEVGSDLMNYNLFSDFAGPTLIESCENIIAERLAPTMLDNNAPLLDKLYTHPLVMGGIIGVSLFASVHGLFLNYVDQVEFSILNYFERLGYFNDSIEVTSLLSSDELDVCPNHPNDAIFS